MKKTPGKDSTTIFGVSVGGKDGLLEDNGGRGPGRPRYGQHHLHRLKPLLIQLPQQHHHHPSSCVMNILFISLSRASLYQTGEWFDKETAFHFTSLSWRQMRVDRALSVGLSGWRPNYDTGTDSAVWITTDKTSSCIKNNKVWCHTTSKYVWTEHQHA